MPNTAIRCCRQGSTSNTIIIIVAIIGGLGILAVLACAGIAFLGFNAVKTIGTDIQASRTSGDAFLDDLKNNQIDAAYAKTSNAFQTGQTLQEFTAFVDRYSTFKTHTSRTEGNIMVFQGTGGKQSTIKFTLITADNAMSCTLVLIQENGQWLVQKLTVP